MAEIGTDPYGEARVAAALAALAEVTDAGDVGALVDATEIEPGLVDLHFATTLPGYPGWRWTVSTGLVQGASAPTVLELTLLPGDGALLAPPWVPWTERLAEWRRSHPGDVDAAEDEDEDDGDLDSDDDLPDEDLLDDDLLDDAVEDDAADHAPLEDDADEHDEPEASDGEAPDGEPSDGGAFTDDASDENAENDEWGEDARGPRPGEVDRGL